MLNGAKTWASGAPDAAFYLVYATVAPGTRAKGITSFVVEKGDEGFTLGKKLPKMGSRCYPTGELFFTDCFVAEDRRIGEEGQGFYGVMRSFDRSRVTLAANSIGIGRAALEYAIDYAKQREAFGKKIHEFQAVSFRLVDAKMALDQARLTDVARGGPGRCGRAVRDRGLDGQARGLGGRVAGGERGRDDASAPTATPANTRWRSGCATRSSRRSTRERATSSG